MKERPILLKGEMVNATLRGDKTQTRRLLRNQNPIDVGASLHGVHAAKVPQMDRGRVVGERFVTVRCPYGEPGTTLWVREAWQAWPFGVSDFDDTGPMSTADIRAGVPAHFEYQAGPTESKGPWRPSIHMPRWASRIDLVVTAVRVERLQAITEADAIAEGATRREWAGGSGWSIDWSRVGQKSRFAGGIHPRGEGMPLTEKDICLSSARWAFCSAWNRINGDRASWSDNPWVWVVSFERIKP